MFGSSALSSYAGICYQCFGTIDGGTLNIQTMQSPASSTHEQQQNLSINPLYSHHKQTTITVVTHYTYHLKQHKEKITSFLDSILTSPGRPSYA